MILIILNLIFFKYDDIFILLLSNLIYIFLYSNYLLVICIYTDLIFNRLYILSSFSVTITI